MTTKEKAQAYDKAIERARDVYTYYCDDREQLRKIESIFPELKESEGEKIRKRIIDALHGDVLDIEETDKAIAWLEEQGEQKSDDKIEPKFKVGDWIVFNGLTLLVNEVIQGYYRTISIDGIHNSYDWDFDNVARLWTIQDVKDGDILATLDYILIFKEFLKNDGGISYCHYDFGAGNPQFVWFEDKNWYFGKGAIIHPATKEQRDLLFQKMHEAGYTWDAEKKELRKIEQKPANWKPSDEQMKALKEACDEHWEPDGLEPLYTLYQGLKKLMEELK